MKIENIKFKNQNQDTKTLADYIGKYGLIIFFYPMAKSPGCSIEAQKFENYFEQIKKSGFGIIGVSKSGYKKNLEFKDDLSLSYDLITDDELVLAKQLGAERSILKIMGTKRTTIILDNKYQTIKKWEHASILNNAKDVYKYIEDYINSLNKTK